MKASNLVRGSLAIRRTKLPLARAPEATTEADHRDAATMNSSAEPEVGLRALSGLETALVLQRAREFAVARGVPEPKEDDELYQYGKAVWCCLLGCVDPDSNAARPEPFFDGGLDQLLALDGLGRDGILLLAELQEQWQEEVSPSARDLEGKAFEEAVAQLAGPMGGTFFLNLRPGMRLSLARSMAALLLTLLRGRSPSGSSSTSQPSDAWTPDADADPELESRPRTPGRLRLRRKGRRR